MFIKRSSWPLGVRMASWETIVTDVDAPMLLKVKRHHSSPRARELSGVETSVMGRDRVSPWRGHDARAGQRVTAGSTGRDWFFCCYDVALSSLGGKNKTCTPVSLPPENLTALER